MTDTSAGGPGLLLPEGTRLVHIGPPKTGTTSLQGSFHARRDEILAQGVRYAGRRRHSSAAVLAVTDRPSFGQDSGSPPIKHWHAIVNEIRTAREPRIIFSSEFFADALEPYIPRIVEDLGGPNVHVVVTLRPLAKILPSQWQQYVQSGLRMDFDPWLDAMYNQPPGPFMATFWRRHRHDELIARWADVVGPERVTVIAMDERDHDHLYRVFEQLLGLRTGTLAAEPDLANRSMTMPEIQAVRAFNNQFKDLKLGNALFHKVMHFTAATHMKLVEPKPEWPRIEVPQWALDRSSEVSAQMVAAIRASGVRVIGDLDGLARVQPSRLQGDVQPETCIPAEIAGRMAMGVLMASDLVRTTPEGTVTASAGRKDVEPLELARIDTYRLAGYLVLRIKRAVLRRARGLLAPLRRG